MKCGLVTAVVLMACLTGRAWAFDAPAVAASVPRIVLLQKDGSWESGSGFVVHSESNACVVATNFHVIAGCKPDTSLYVLRKIGGGIEARKAEIIAKSNERDLALLRVPGFNAKALVLLTVEPAQAEDVYSIGYPGVADDRQTRQAIFKILGNGSEGVLADPDGKTTKYLEASVSRATVRRVVLGSWPNRGGALTFKIIEHDVNIGHGNSGGPLFNGAGQVVGVATGGRFSAKGQDVDKFSESSHISSLIELLKAERIDFLQAATTEKAPIVAVVSQESRGRPYLLTVFSGIAAVALVVALSRRRTLVESYTQYVRRSLSKPDTQAAAPPVPAGKDTTLPSKKPARPLCVFEGENPEGGRQIRFVVSDKILEETDQRIVVGRSGKQARFCIKNSSVSAVHLVLHCRNGSFQVEDRESSNGTRINGRKIPPFASTPLADGDKLEIGNVVLQFQSLT